MKLIGKMGQLDDKSLAAGIQTQPVGKVFGSGPKSSTFQIKEERLCFLIALATQMHIVWFHNDPFEPRTMVVPI